MVQLRPKAKGRMKSRKKKLPAKFVFPMKALGRSDVPDTAAGAWHGEIKFDGYRAVAVINEGDIQLWSRTQKPLDYPEIVTALQRIKCENATLDGEIVALDTRGRSNFQHLQGRDLGERPPIAYYLFDLLHWNGRSFLDEPFEVRRAALEKFAKKLDPKLQLSRVFDVPPTVLWREVGRIGLEGMILKHAQSLYEPGHRSGEWLKIKRVNEQEFVIGGFTPPQRSRPHFGAILVGYYRERKLIYAGKVGTGFDFRLLEELHAKFLKNKIAHCPFANLPLERTSRFGTGMTRSAMRHVTWVEPTLVAQIKFAEWTLEGLLRQPVFLGLRADKRARDVVREATAA